MNTKKNPLCTKKTLFWRKMYQKIPQLKCTKPPPKCTRTPPPPGGGMHFWGLYGGFFGTFGAGFLVFGGGFLVHFEGFYDTFFGGGLVQLGGFCGAIRGGLQASIVAKILASIGEWRCFGIGEGVAWFFHWQSRGKVQIPVYWRPMSGKTRVKPGKTRKSQEKLGKTRKNQGKTRVHHPFFVCPLLPCAGQSFPSSFLAPLYSGNGHPYFCCSQ